MKNNMLLVLRIVVIIILVQTLRYKFTGHPDSVFIFSKIGLEPYGRIGIGILELITSILLLIRKTAWLGSVLAVGLMGGAVFLHITKLGIEVQGDSGMLFYMALVTLVISLALFWVYRKEIPVIGKKL